MRFDDMKEEDCVLYQDYPFIFNMIMPYYILSSLKNAIYGKTPTNGYFLCVIQEPTMSASYIV